MECELKEVKIPSVVRFERYIFDSIATKIIDKKIPSPTHFLKGGHATEEWASITENRTTYKNLKVLDLDECVERAGFKILDADVQVTILNYAKGLRHWMGIAAFCEPAAVENSAKDLLKEMGLDYSFRDTLRGETATEKLLHYFFDQMYQSLSEDELTIFFKELNKVSPSIEATASQVQKTTETVLEVISEVFANNWVQCAVGIVTWICVYKGAKRLNSHIFNKYVPRLVTPIINHVPGKVIRSISWMFDNKWKIFAAIALSKYLLPSQSFSRRFVEKVEVVSGRLLWLPSTIAGLPWDIAGLARRKVFPVSNYSAQILKTGSKGLEVNRKAREVAKARQFWEQRITEIKKLAEVNELEEENESKKGKEKAV